MGIASTGPLRVRSWPIWQRCSGVASVRDVVNPVTTLEVDEVIEAPLQRSAGGAQHRPVMALIRNARFFHGPPEVRRDEAHRLPDRGQLVVVEEYDTASVDQPSEVDEIEEDAIEAMVPIDEGNIEASSFVQQAGQRDLGGLRIELQ